MSFFARMFGRAADPPAGPLQRGERALQRGDLDAAETHFGEALDAAAGDRDRALALNKRALVAIARGDLAGAQAVLDAALATYAACVPAIVNCGNLLLEAGDIAGAIARYEIAITLDPDYPRRSPQSGRRLQARRSPK